MCTRQDSQQVSSGDCPGSDQALEPLPGVSLFQQSRQHHLQQQQLQRQLTHGGVAGGGEGRGGGHSLLD